MGIGAARTKWANDMGHPLDGMTKMKISDIADFLETAATDMRTFAARNDDFYMPEQVILSFITNFLTDERLRRLSPADPSGSPSHP